MVVGKDISGKTHKVKVINYKGAEDTIRSILSNIRAGKKISTKTVKQSILCENAINWNFIKQDKAFLDLCNAYESNNESMSAYYLHSSAKVRFGDAFYFDGSFNIPTKDIVIKKQARVDCWEIPYLKSSGFRATIHGFYPKSKKVKIAHGSQGMVMLDTKYKVIWRYANPDKFLFIEGKNVFPRFQQFCIASNNKEEILYLLSLLNSKTITLIIEKLCKSENEKDILVGLSVIKQHVRVPAITDHNRHIKKEVIDRTEEMLGLEELTLSDYVDFSGILVQKFEDVRVEDNDLILVHNGQEVVLPIKKNTSLVASSIAEQLGGQRSVLEKSHVSLQELRNLPIIDDQRQKILKAYIDDLVFALYFGIPLRALGLKNATAVRKACLTNQHYQYILKYCRRP